MSIEMTAALLAESNHLVTDRELPSCRRELDPYDPRRVGWRRVAWPNVDRLSVAFALPLDVEACAGLLAGRAVDPARLDPINLARASEASLVRLVAPLDLLSKKAV